MKFFIITILTISIISLPVLANDNTSVTLNKIENYLFGYTYNNESSDKRLARIEENVYGKTFNGDMNQRLSKIEKDTISNLIGQEIPPKEDSFEDDSDGYMTQEEIKEANNMDYPVIDEMENKLFHKKYSGEKINNRLSRLESKIFSKNFEQDDFATRVDRLKVNIQPTSFANNEMDKQNNEFYDDEIKKMTQNYHIPEYGNDGFDYNSINMSHNLGNNTSVFNNNYNAFKSKKILNIGTIERILYNQKYESEIMSSRLSRIENSIFGTVFSNDNETQRLERINAAIAAQKSAKKYDSNKFSQNITTAVQIGTLILMVLACIL